MKNILILIAATASQLVVAQYGNVGINTTNPTRTLDINGNLKISNLTNASEDGGFAKILIADAVGNVDYIVRADLLPAKDIYTSNKEVINNLYSNTVEAGISSKEIKCGKFKFAFGDTSESYIKFALIDKPSGPISIYMSMEQNYSDGGFQFFQGTTSTNATPFTFTVANYNVLQDFASGNLANREQNIMHFQYPNDQFFYRLTVYRVTQSITVGTKITNTYNFVTSCEKF